MVSISLRVILLAMVLVVAIVAAAVSFAPLYDAALSNAEESALAFSFSISREIATSVAEYFAVMQSTATVMTAAARLGGWAPGDVVGITKWMGYGVTLGADSINMIFDGTDMWTAGYVRPDNTDVAEGTFVLVAYNSTYGVEHIVGADNLTTLSTRTFASTLSFHTRQYFSVIRYRQGWGNPFIGVSLGVAEAVLPCGAPIKLPDGTAVGGFYVRTRAKIIVNYFRGLKVKETGRAMLVDPLTGFFVASNSAADPLTKVVGATTVVANYTDVQDPLIRKVVSSLGNALLTCTPMPCSFEVGTGDDLVYVTVANVNDTFALNKRLVVMIPSEDFLGKVRGSSKTSLGAAAGAVAGLMALAVVAVMLIVRPLGRLEARLYASVTLEDEDAEADNAPSMIQEIGNIEVAYGKLQAELKKVKSFLPQSVLKQLEEADEAAGGDEDEGSIHQSDAATDSVSNSRRSPSGARSSKHNDSSAAETNKASTIGGLSHTSEERRRAIERGRTLNTTSALALRTCTVVMANVEGLHRYLKAPADLASMHTAVMTIVADAVNGVKGVFDAFHGDRFTLTFNSSTNCASHCSSAAGFMLAVRAAVAAARERAVAAAAAAGGRKAAVASGILFGAATGKALCGNLGTERIKRFCTVGAVVNHASVLLAACRGLQVDNLVSPEALKGMQFEYVCDNVSIATLPHCEVAGVLSTVRERRSAKMDEWMYELEESEKTNAVTGDPVHDTLAALNKAVESARDGNNAAAAAALAKSPAPVPEPLAVRAEHVRMLVAQQESGKPFPVMANC